MPTKYLFIVMQINEYDITKEIGEHSYRVRFIFMVLNATFNYISAISWQSVLLVEETGVLREKHRPVVSHWQTLSHKLIMMNGVQTHNFSALIA